MKTSFNTKLKIDVIWNVKNTILYSIKNKEIYIFEGLVTIVTLLCMYVCRCSLSIVTLLEAYKTVEDWHINMLIEISRKPMLVPFDPTNIRYFLQNGGEKRN